MSLNLPDHYDPHMTVRETQDAIKFIRDLFQKEFGKEMHLERISAHLGNIAERANDILPHSVSFNTPAEKK